MDIAVADVARTGSDGLAAGSKPGPPVNQSKASVVRIGTDTSSFTAGVVVDRAIPIPCARFAERPWGSRRTGFGDAPRTVDAFESRQTVSSSAVPGRTPR